MIKANELRIGNFIKFNNHIQKEMVVTVDARFFCSLAGGRPMNEIKPDEEINDYYSPIKLTKEIVSEITPNLFDWFIEGSYILVPDEEYGWCLKVRNAAHFKEIEFGYFKYLHQLQNIYYILSQGVELEWTGSSSS